MFQVFTVRSEPFRRKPRMNKCNLGTQGDICLWLGRNGGMDPSSSPYVTHYSSFHVRFHSLFPANQRPKYCDSKGFYGPNVRIYVKACT